MSNQMSKSDAARIQSTQARGGKDMSSGGFAARAQSAADTNANNNAKTGGVAPDIELDSNFEQKWYRFSKLSHFCCQIVLKYPEWFAACQDVVKKPKLDQHRARCGSSFTCIDCSTTFPGPAEYKSHTTCISEAEKYQKALYKGPKAADQGASGTGRGNGRGQQIMRGGYTNGRGRGRGGHLNAPNRSTGANNTPLGTPVRRSPVDPDDGSGSKSQPIPPSPPKAPLATSPLGEKPGKQPKEKKEPGEKPKRNKEKYNNTNSKKKKKKQDAVDESAPKMPVTGETETTAPAEETKAGKKRKREAESQPEEKGEGKKEKKEKKKRKTEADKTSTEKIVEPASEEGGKQSVPIPAILQPSPAVLPEAAVAKEDKKKAKKEKKSKSDVTTPIAAPETTEHQENSTPKTEKKKDKKRKERAEESAIAPAEPVPEKKKRRKDKDTDLHKPADSKTDAILEDIRSGVQAIIDEGRGVAVDAEDSEGPKNKKSKKEKKVKGGVEEGEKKEKRKRKVEAAA